MRVAVVGTGGVGGYFGALLAKAGHDTTFIARGNHLKAIRENGLTIHSDVSGKFTVRAPASDETDSVGPVDLVLFTVKMYDNAEAMPAVKPLIGKDSIVLSLQNGVDNGDRLARLLGPNHVMIGSAYIEGVIKAPGLIEQIGSQCRVVFGELKPGITTRGQAMLKAFLKSNWQAELVEDAYASLWAKFVYIAATAGVCSASQTVYEEMRSTPETRQLLTNAMEEIAEVARAKKVDIPHNVVKAALTALDGFATHSRSSMAKDFARGSRVELDGLTGTVIRLGRELDVPTPINEMLYAILKPLATKATTTLQNTVELTNGGHRT